MQDKKYYCLYCMEWLTAKPQEPKERQCSNCRRRKGLISEENYLRGIAVAKDILKRKKPKVPFIKAAGDVADVLKETFPSLLLPGKTLLEIIREAQEEIKKEKTG